MKVKSKFRGGAVKKTSAKKPAAARTGQAITPKKTALAVKPQAKPKKQICANERRAYDHGRRHGYKAEKERQTVRGAYPKATEKMSFDAGTTVGIACCRIEKAAVKIEKAAEKVMANVQGKIKSTGDTK